MDLNFTHLGKVKVRMKGYIEEAIQAFPDELSTRAPKTPAADHIFEVNPDGVPIDQEKKIIFHHIVAKLLFVSTRGRPDIQVPISFLTSRVAKPTEDDWKKLARVLGYLKDTMDLCLTLQSNDMSVIKYWTDAAYGVREDFKSQTGAVMSFGRGGMMTKSTKQKLNTKSACEAELVGASDMIPQLLWTRYFLNEQGYNIKEAILYQDNQSAILLQKNGRASSGKRTKHINIQYFFMVDRIKNEELQVEYCPTNDMLADFFTKPLQGSKFMEFRDIILGYAELTPVNIVSNSERVGRNGNLGNASSTCKATSE